MKLKAVKIICASLIASILSTGIIALPVQNAFAEDSIQIESNTEVFSDVAVTYENAVVQSTINKKGTWIKENNGRWWYKHSDGSYTKYDWEYIDGNWYFFDKNGWMWTEWLQWDGNWYYLNPSGVMHTGWLKDDGKYYYFNSRGVMATGWAKINGADYYFDSDGAMCIGWIKVNNKWYYMNTDGSMRVGWIKLNGNWYYLNTDGSMRTGWIKLENKWYYFNSSGVMLRGWQTIDGNRYYFASDGHMVTESFTEGKRTFTFFSSGKLNSTVMNINRIDQGKTNWCWAAGAAMIANYENNTNLTMENVVVAVRGTTVGNNTGAPDDEILATMQTLLPNRGVQRMYNFKYDTFEWYINKNHPVLICVNIPIWQDRHILTCAGYRKDDDSLYFVDSTNYVNKQFKEYDETERHIFMGLYNGYANFEYIIIYP